MKKYPFAGWAALAALSFCMGITGCQKLEQGQQGKIEGIKTIAKAAYPEEPVYKNEEERWEDKRSREMPEYFRTAYEDFSYETASALLKNGTDNQIYSPLSFYFALASAAQGTGGETRAEILKVLGYPYAEDLSDDCKSAFEFLYHVPNEKNNRPNEWGEYPGESRYTLRIANSLWADERLKLKEEFANHVARYFYGDVYQADLDAEETRNAMADWVREKTNGVVEPDISSDNGDILLSLCNTIYFYDEWVDRFETSATAEDLFTLSDGSKVSCDFMNQKMGSHGFRRAGNYTVSSLGLKNGQMTFVLPDSGVSVRSLLESPEKLREVFDGSEGGMMGEVIWKVPKFSYGSSMEFTDMLKNLGITKAFSAAEADFSNLADLSESPEIQGLYLFSATQDAHIGIDENGVEAAAFTELAVCGAGMPTGRAEMILDRPFLYAIYNRGQLLFVGVCENPAK